MSDAGASADQVRNLAAAVLARAVKDAADPSLPETTRRGARTFLDGGGGVWAELAGLEPDAIARRARRMSGGPFHAAPLNHHQTRTAGSP